MYEPATDEQMETLRRLGVSFPRPVSHEVAELFIKSRIATDRQIECLGRFGHRPDGPVHRLVAANLIGEAIDRRRQLPPTPKQERFLKDRGQWREGITRGEAFDLIGQIMAKE